MKRTMVATLLLLVCLFSTTVGGTIAWFTDSVTSDSNIIKSGTLDVEMYWADGTIDPNNATWTDASSSKIFDYALWEPGYVQVRHIKIENVGNLALNYSLTIAANEAVSKLADVIDVYFLDPAQQVSGRAALANATPAGTLTEMLAGTPVDAAARLEAKDSDVVTIALKMKEEAGNEYQGLSIGTNGFAVKLEAVQATVEEDSFDNQYDAEATAKIVADTQAALDNAKPGDVIKLVSGVNYGTLLIRPVDGNANTTTSLNEADGEGLTGYRNEYIRKVENLTIIGAPGAKVDAIKVVSGYIEGSGSSCNLVDVKGLVIDSVEFTDKADCAPHTYSAPIFFNLTWTDVDGLTVKNCKLIGNDDKVNFVYFTIDASSAFDGVASNVTLTGNTVDGIARLCELRGTENVTITGNTVKNTALHGVLLAGSGYSGKVVISNNTFDGVGSIGDVNVVRMAGADNASVTISNNTATNYLGGRDDFAKVDGGNPVIENNSMTRAHKVSTVDDLKAALVSANDGDTVYLASVDFGNVDLYNTTNNGHRYEYADYRKKNISIVGQNGTSFSKLRLGENDTSDIIMTGWTFKNISFTGDGLIISMNNKDVTVENCTFTGTELQNTGTSSYQATDFIVKDCTFDGGHATRKTQLAIQNSNGLTVTGCTFTNAAYNAMNVTEIHGNVTIEGNAINKTADRPLRFKISDATAVLSIKNNTIVSDGNAEGQLLKADGTVTADNITLSGNTWNGSSDSGVTASMVDGAYIVE